MGTTGALWLLGLFDELLVLKVDDLLVVARLLRLGDLSVEADALAPSAALVAVRLRLRPALRRQVRLLLEQIGDRVVDLVDVDLAVGVDLEAVEIEHPQ